MGFEFKFRQTGTKIIKVDQLNQVGKKEIGNK